MLKIFRICTLFAILGPVSAQTLRVQIMENPAGERPSATILLESLAGKHPVALQWDLLVPEQAIHVEENGILLGQAAVKAGKSITCSAVPGTDARTRVYRCILAGGTENVAAGP